MSPPDANPTLHLAPRPQTPSLEQSWKAPYLEGLEAIAITDASRPQKNFRYLEFSEGPEVDDLDYTVRAILRSAAPDSVHLAATPEAALADWLRQQKITGAVGMSVPAPLEFMRLAHEKVELVPMSRDPEDMYDFDFSRLSALLITNPNRADGFYYPQEIYSRLIERALRANPDLKIYSEESTGLFSFNMEAPGTADAFRKSERVWIAGSVFPVRSPQGPELSWYYGAGKTLGGPSLAIDPEDLKRAYRALLAFSQRQGAAIAEYQRRMMVVAKSLRNLADGLKPAFNAKKVKVPLWPETGFYLMLELPDHDADSWVRHFLAEERILLRPGKLLGNPKAVQLCYAGNPTFLEALGKKICAHLV